MGAIIFCCDERDKSRLRTLKNKKLINNTSIVLYNYEKSKKKHSVKSYENNNKNNSDIQSKSTEEDNIEINITKNKEKQKIDKTKKPNIEINEKEVNNKNNNKTNKNNLKKGKLIMEGRFYTIYSGLSSNGEITMKIYNNLSNMKKQLIIKNLDNLYKLNHKNIIKAIPLSDIDINEENEEFTLIYEYFNSKNIEDMINNFGSLDEKIIQIYSKQLLEGLRYLHENNIYHKNLKPNNIFTESDGTIKIFDNLVDNLLLGNAKEYYEYILKSDKIEYYIPPFFIKSINEYKEKNNKINNNLDNTPDNNEDNIFNDWKSFDLYFLGCLIIEIFTKKKPWGQFNFQNNLKLFDFLGTTNLLPDIPKYLSIQCKELINTLFNYSLTQKPDIYDIIFNLDFFKMDITQFTYNTIISCKSNKNDNQKYSIKIEHSNKSSINTMRESGKQLGKILENNHVVNILNNNNNASFSVSITVEDSNYSSIYIQKKNTKEIRNSEMITIKESRFEQFFDPVNVEKEKFISFHKD